MSSSAQPPTVFFGTHHKSGTVWMATVLRRFCARTGTPFFDFSHACRESGIEPEARGGLLDLLRPSLRGVVFADHSEGFAIAAPQADEQARFLHVVRDPRDMAISAARYHLRAEERWLLEPNERFGGLCYREALAALDGLDEQVRFEADNSTRWAVRDLRELLGVDGLHVIRYEDLVAGPGFDRLYETCGFPEAQRADFDAACDHADRVRERHQADPDGHVSDGGVEQWRRAIRPDTAALLTESFGDVIEGLGYAAS